VIKVRRKNKQGSLKVFQRQLGIFDRKKPCRLEGIENSSADFLPEYVEDGNDYHLLAAKVVWTAGQRFAIPAPKAARGLFSTSDTWRQPLYYREPLNDPWLFGTPYEGKRVVRRSAPAQTAHSRPSLSTS
jgi:hypothetical protein